MPMIPRPGLAEGEIERMKELLKYWEWQVEQLKQAIAWAEKGFVDGVVLPAAAAVAAAPSVRPRDLVHQLLADHQPHAKDDIIDAVRKQVGPSVHIAGIIAALRAKPIVRLPGDMYQLPVVDDRYKPGPNWRHKKG